MTERPIQSPAELGKLFREMRKRLGYSQTELAGIAGTGERFIVDLEKGKATIELGKALHVARMLGLKMYARFDQQ